MENAVEALKFACAVMIFAFALALSISSFSQANEAVTSIVQMRDRETEYTYVVPTENLTRTVGVETVVPSMYRAYKENIEIFFFKANGDPLILYEKTDNNGNIVQVNYIDLSRESFGTPEEAVNHLDALLKSQYDGSKNLYEYFVEQDGFEEKLGEYYQETGTSKIKKRVITYKIVEE